MSSNSCTATSDILLFFHPVARSGTTSSSALDLFFLGAILESRARFSARGLRERLRNSTSSGRKNWEIWIRKWRRLGNKRVKTLGVTERINKDCEWQFCKFPKVQRSSPILSVFAYTIRTGSHATSFGSLNLIRKI